MAMSPTVTMRCTDSMELGDRFGTRSETIAAPTRKNAGAGMPTLSPTRFDTTASSSTRQTTPIVTPKVRMSSTPGTVPVRATVRRWAHSAADEAPATPKGRHEPEQEDQRRQATGEGHRQPTRHDEVEHQHEGGHDTEGERGETALGEDVRRVHDLAL